MRRCLPFLPTNVWGSFKELDFCQILRTGKESNVAACVAPPKSITGVCPQAKFKVSVKIYDNKRLAHKTAYIYLFITPPARRAWRSYKFAPFLFFLPCRKSAHRSWVTPLCIVWAKTLTQFLAEYVTKTHNLTCILRHLSSKKVVRSKIRIQNVS